MKRKISVPKSHLSGEIRAESFNSEARTVDVVASTGSRVKRGGFFSDPFFQELDVSKRSIRMERFINGAPVLDNHGNGVRDGASAHAFGVRDQMGVVENPRIEKVKRAGETEEVNALVVTVRFSEREEFAGIVKDIEQRIIRNVSIGFNIHRNKELEERVGETKIFRATDWEPVELSFVPAGADPDSMTKNHSNDSNDCEFEFLNSDNERGANLGKKKEDGQPTGETQTRGSENVTPIDEEKLKREAAQAAVKIERQRATDIKLAVRSAKLDDTVSEEMIERGISADEARTEVLAKMAEKDKEVETRSVNAEVGADLSRVNVQRGIGSALLLRLDPNFQLDKRENENEKLIGAAQPYKHMRLLDLAKECLLARGETVKGLSAMEIAQRGLHSTSDFPLILANVVNKTLRRGYLESPATFLPFTRVVEVSDFKEISRNQFGDAATLVKKQENGEYQSGTIGEAAEKYSVEEYGRIIPIGRRVIINDDMNAFSQLPAKMGIQARNLESDLVWTDLLSNPIMSDTFALFSAQHGNLGTAAALSDVTLAEARKLMRLQVGLGGNKLNLTPKWLYTPVALETTADKIVTSVTPNNQGDISSFSAIGKTPLQNLAEPRIDDSSAIEHYVMADQNQIDMYEMAMLQGERGPVTDSEIDFNTDGVKFKIRHTVGVKAIDHRGMVKNDGA